MIQLEFDVVAVGPAAASLQNLEHHGARDNVAPCQVLRVRRIALHEALAIFIDEVTALSSTPLGNQRPGPVDASRVKLPHLHILSRDAGAQRHTHAVTGVDMRIRG